MKKLLFLLFLISCSSLYSQNLIQTYTDRCTGEVKVFSVPMNGSAVVAFYNRSKVFTAADFQNGNLQAWLEETYLWWSSLNPCSTNQTQQTTVQTTVQQTTTQATQAAAQAAATPPPTPVAVPQPTPTTNATPPTTNTPEVQTTPEVAAPTVDTSSTDTGATDITVGSTDNTSQPTTQEQPTSTDQTSTGNQTTNEGSSETPSTETSESQTETQQTESTSDDSGGNDSSSSEGEDSSTSQEENGDDSESTSEETSEETESESEETEEQEVEEEKSESEESESEDESKEDNKKEKKKKEKKTFSPPIISANIASMQNIDGSFNQTMTIGVSRSSLLGTETYSVNGMVWDNLQQFMLNGSYSKVHINKEGRVNRVYSASLGGARMFTTTMGNMAHSLVFLGKKGSVKGLALAASVLSVEFDYYKGKISQDAVLFAPSLTGFYTKPFQYNPRLTISPMLAVSSPFMLHDVFEHSTTWNSDLMAIVGSNFDLMLTKRFKLNVGVNTINNTNPNIKMTWNFTIGSRFSF